MTTSEQITTTFMAKVDAGYIHPQHMVAVLQAMHAALVDRFPGVDLFMTPSLEDVSDRLVVAMRSAEIQEQDNPEEVAA